MVGRSPHVQRTADIFTRSNIVRDEEVVLNANGVLSNKREDPD
jgi:hypothetical protein